MKISDIRIRNVDQPGRLLALVSITIDDMMVIHDIKIIDGPNGCFIAMPNRKMPNGEYRDIVHPINSETRTMIHGMILDAYSDFRQNNSEDTQRSDL